MARFVIVPADQVAKVTGPTSNGAALAPIALASGEGALPERVLSDDDHLVRRKLLASFPVREVADKEWPPER